MLWKSLGKAALVGLAVIAAVSTKAAIASSQDEVMATFRQFIAAQNADDLTKVSAIVDDADVLWIVRGTAIRGREAVLQAFRANYGGTWIIAPDFDKADITDLAPGVAQVVVPASISIAPAGQDSSPRRFLLTQFCLKRNERWKLATIVTVPGPPSP